MSSLRGGPFAEPSPFCRAFQTHSAEPERKPSMSSPRGGPVPSQKEGPFCRVREETVSVPRP